MKAYYVYIHKRKDNGTPFYVGCATRQDKIRGKHKYKRAYDFGQRKPDWFKIRDLADGVVVEIFFETKNRKEAFDRETEIINKLGRIRFNDGLLTNECDGGSGCPNQTGTVESRRKKSITKLGTLNPMYGKTGKDHPTTRRVINVKTSKIYESVSEAAYECGFKMKTLYNWLSGHRKNMTDLRFI